MKKNLNYVNLTPHKIRIYAKNREDVLLEVESSGSVRVNTEETIIGVNNYIPVVKTEYQEVLGLPEPKENTVYIVSILVLQALKGSREDCVAPNTSPSSCVRDTNGNILGSTSFTVI